MLLLLTFAMLFYNFRMTYAVLYYSFNNAEFTEKYCENKDKPVMKCNGKCKLAKLAKEAEKNNSNKNNVAEKETILYFQSIEKIEFVVFLPQKIGIKTKCSLRNYNSTRFNFHPPNSCFSFS
ncbi:MAG: hypothetical protein JHC39_00085 [Lentimicrobium sp.]|nr:hypothetical protein [Lentimicrobium sp.]